MLAVVFGTIGVLTGWIPVLGRFSALACGVVAIVSGILNLRRNPRPAMTCDRDLAVAGLALGAVCLFESLRGFLSNAVLVTALTGFFS